MTSSLDMIRGRQVVQTLTNQSGGSVIAGDVVIVSAANDESFTTTTSAAYNSTRVGVAQESIAAAATGRILLEGYAPLVNVSASATRGHYLLTHTVAKQATSQAGYAAGAFGQILKAGTTPSAMIFPVAQVGSAGVGGSSGSTDNAIIRADGTGGATVQSSLATIDDSGTVNIPTGQTYNINNTPHTHAATGAMVQIAQVAVGVGGAASIDFNSIPGTYTNLMLTGLVRGEKAATLITPAITFNADSAGNYDREYFEVFDTTPAGGGTAGAAGVVFNEPAANSPANYFGFFKLEIPYYANTTTYKVCYVTASEARAQNANSYGNMTVVGYWRNTAAITRVTLTPDSGNWAQYSIVTLYGWT